MRRRLLTLAALALLAAAGSAAGAGAQGLDPGILAGGETSARILQLAALVTVLSIAPGLLIMVTSFTRFAIAFSFLRSGLGIQGAPAGMVLASLALFMTFFVMAPVFDRAWDAGMRPLLERRITEEEAARRIAEPFRAFMQANVRDKDLRLFADLARRTGGEAAPPETGEKAVDLRVLVPAFMISELRRGFEIGFLVILPFLVIDLAVATLVMAMGMMMMPPTVIALPVKVLFFILIDGWNILVGSLVRSVQ